MSKLVSSDTMMQNGYGKSVAIPLFLLVVILLIGAFLRLYPLSDMTDMIAPDESVYGLDALSLLQNPRLTPFFPANYGREGGWMYWVAGWFALLGVSSTTMRIASVMIGMLTIAATYRLGRELFNRQTGLWVALALAILFWHIHFSHLAFRAITFPLLGTLTFAFLWRGFKTYHRKFWIAGGIFLGLSLYTYFAARVWIGYAGLTLFAFYLYDRKLWRHIAWCAFMAGLVSIPMFLYWVTYPDLAFQRFSGVAISGFDQVLPNITEWARMWTIEGDWFEHHNIPLRPVLDTPLLILAIAGVLGLLITTWRKGAFVWIVGLLGVSAVGILTTHANSLIRNIGSVIPVALIIGYGAWSIQQLGKKWRIGWIIPASLLGMAGFISLNAVSDWLAVPALYTRMERHIGQGMAYLAENTPIDARLYFVPFPSSHPVLRFHSQPLSPRIIGGFDATVCQVIPDVPEAWYFSVIQWDADFERRLALWGDVEQIYAEPNTPPRYAIYHLKPNISPLESAEPIILGDKIELRLLSVIPQTIRQTDTLSITLAMRRVGEILDPLETYTLFVHAYDSPLPENVVVRAQLDVPLCHTTPPYDWREDEWVIQSFSMSFPPEIVAGMYQVVMGVYVQPSFTRLPITPTTDSYLLQIITLEE